MEWGDVVAMALIAVLWAVILWWSERKLGE